MVLQTKFAQINNNDLLIDNVSALQLAKQYGTPLYVMSEGHIRHQFETMKTKMTDKYENTLPLYASKAFTCLAIYKIAKEYGIGLDCVSGGEISVALKAGFDPKKIYFHGNNKTPEEIEYAIKNGVENIVIDNFYEIDLIQEIASRLNIKVKGIARIAPGVYAGAHDYIRVGIKDTKFGFSSHDNSYLKAIKKIIDASHIDFEGIHCHVGSQIEDIEAYKLAMDKFAKIAFEIHDIFGVAIKQLNAGGGFGIAYTNEDKPLEFEYVVDTIMDILDKSFKKEGLPRPKILVEPGRFCVGNAGITLYTVGSYKNIEDVRNYISVDGGMNDNIRTALYQAKYQALVVNKASQEADTKVTVAGKNCESGDILIKDIMLQNPQPKDILAVFSTGAYNYTMSSNYNQNTKPAVVFTYQGKSRVVIRRQTYDDLVTYDVDSTY